MVRTTPDRGALKMATSPPATIPETGAPGEPSTREGSVLDAYLTSGERAAPARAPAPFPRTANGTEVGDTVVRPLKRDDDP